MINDMMRAEIWLHERLDTQQGIEELAERLGYSASQIRRNFKRCFGLSPSAYRDKLRLDQATLLLSYTPLNINDIAFKCGYRNHSAFSRAFLRHHNVSPRTFREQEQSRLQKLRSQLRHEYEVTIDHAQAKQGIVTRFYAKRNDERTLPDELLSHEALEVLPEKLRRKRTIGIVYGFNSDNDFSTADMGVEVEADIADELAAPLLFRTIPLPTYRYASVDATALSELRSILNYLLTKALPEQEERISGAPLQLVWRDEGVNALGQGTFEVRLPLAAPASGARVSKRLLN
ncbi:helix-turn-helix transcriptional regulator [Litchfieldella xinjiangensis]|uniref:helix-turn-helix transcriptional regulator n=1 Tax=Litchfieldella xinjiangensis TaxID=1166948 RepID=UPI000693C727|nr:AraC family transcriptional regulator [Halomonas xinjiangensis]